MAVITTRLTNVVAGSIVGILLLFSTATYAETACHFDWDGHAEPIVALAGPWCATHDDANGVLSIPGTWYNKKLAGQPIPGSASVRYYVHVNHPELTHPLVLRLPRPYDSYRLYVNGQMLLATGHYRADGAAERYPHYIQFQPQGSVSTIEVDVYNQQFMAGGMRSPPRIGNADSMYESRARALAIEGFQSGLLALMAFIQLAQFAAARRVYAAQLFFGLTCLSVAIFSGLGGEQWLSLLLKHWGLAPDLALRWAMIPLAILGLTEFSSLLFPDEFHRRPRQWWRVIAGLFLIACIVADGRPLALLFWLMECAALLMSAYVLYATFLAAKHKRPGALSLTVVYGILFITVMRDIAVDFQGQYLGNLGPTGMVICLVWQGLLLARQSARDYKKSVDLVRQLEQAEAVKDEFLANTSHELRTPLQTIIGLAGIDSQVDDQRGHNAALIGDTARRLALLVDDLMDLTRMRHQGIHVQATPLAVRDEFETLQQLFSPMIRHRDLRIVIDLTDDMLAVRADPKRLRQVLYNLLGNAVKFTAEGDITLYAYPCEGAIRIGVRDTGPGMGSKQLQLARQRYQQGSIASEGVGLGLPISHGILHAHGSALEINSTLGIGTDCHFLLPQASLTKQTAPVRAPNQDSPPSRRAPTADSLPESDYILLVDDDGCILDTLTQVLSSLDYPVIAKSRVDDALSLINDRPPALLVLDLMMPAVSGFEIVEMLRQHYSPSRLPILVLSARQAESDQQRALLLGANDFLVKPCEPLELCNRAEAQLALRENYRHRWLQRLEEQEQDHIINELLRSDRPVIVTNTQGKLLLGNESGKKAIASGREQAELNLPLQGQRRLLLWPTKHSQQSPRSLLVAAMREAVRCWEEDGRSRIQLAEQSGQWRVQLDGSTARSRTFDRYTSLASLPKRPNVDRIISTVRHVEQHLPASGVELQNLLARIEALRSVNPRVFISQ